MFTLADYSLMIDHAGAVNRDAKRDGGLSVFLMEAQGGLCFDCGTAPATEFCHFIRTKERSGRMHANGAVMGAMGCRECNEKHDALTSILGTDGLLPFAYLNSKGRAERIITEYPSRKVLENLWIEYTAAKGECAYTAARREIEELGL